jgi:hypothetical protein
VSALTAAGAIASLAIGGVAAAQGIPATPVEASTAVTSKLVAGQFSAYIMPAKGYTGPRFVGTMPGGRAHVPTLSYDLTGHLAPVTSLQRYFPDDMAYFGGPVLPSVSQVNVYWANNTGSLWGNPATFEGALNTSNMIELVNRYTFQPQSNGHWPVASYFWYFPGGGPGALVYDNQVQSEVRSLAAADVAAGRQSSASWSAIYHVFLPPGTDECFTNPAQGCYNPDGHAPGPFAFCAYHGYTQLPSGQYVAYDVQPYAEVSGCQQSGTGLEAQDQANVLGHELAEAISDAIPGAGWYQEWPTGDGEIGDECAFEPIKQILGGGQVYYIQDWYSTARHDCDNVY